MRRISVAFAVLATAAATSAAGASTRGTTLSLVGYSTPKTVMGKIVQAWQQTPDGRGTNVNQSYGASTDQARAVAAGLKGDIVFLSTGDDVNLLVDAGLVDPNWDKQS
jgi:sulfate transport system substrate-binding protein